MHGDNFASRVDGILEVAMWLCAPLPIGLYTNLSLVPNYVMLVLGNEGGSLSYTSYTGPKDWFKEATLNMVFSVCYTKYEGIH
jgi:hypothetical protein